MQDSPQYRSPARTSPQTSSVNRLSNSKSRPPASANPDLCADLPTELPDDDDDAEVPALLSPAQAVRALAERVDATGHGRRLDQWLAARATEFSRNHLQALIERGCVQVDGKVIDQPSKKVASGQLVEARLEPTAQSLAFVPEAMDLPIVFEDEHLLVINKPVGLVVHPAAGHWGGTLLNGLLAHHEAAQQLPRAGIVHRLDKDTSGLMVVGKSLQACTALTRAIAAREVHRRYRALVWGHPPEAVRIDTPVGRDPVSRVRMAVVHSGKPAMTDVRTLATVDWISETGGADRTISAVECTLHTGRTHQIRVHMASRRWPLVADALYGGAPALGLQRQALHAVRLELAHPLNGEPLTFEASLPPDMAQAWAQVVHNGPAGV
jgi:23S rRNA pseudouridine1911/1915/1917 synthase